MEVMAEKRREGQRSVAGEPRKTDVVLWLLRGEKLDGLSRSCGRPRRGAGRSSWLSARRAQGPGGGGGGGRRRLREAELKVAELTLERV